MACPASLLFSRGWGKIRTLGGLTLENLVETLPIFSYSLQNENNSNFQNKGMKTRHSDLSPWRLHGYF